MKISIMSLKKKFDKTKTKIYNKQIIKNTSYMIVKFE